ncbi:MAG: ABC transporter permease, partial [Sulfitobacter sp.]|nr:ABC transporter permease [Sulfitobacter sp.]
MLRLIPIREAILGSAILVMILLIASRFSGFVAPSNLANVFNDTAPLIILALGQMVVILTRCIDLSVAANLALTGMAVAMINVAMPGLPIPFIIVIAISLG